MSMRIIAPGASVATKALNAESAATTDQYLSRLVKLVPGESISAYPLLVAIAVEQGLWAQILVSWLLFAVTIILRWHATSGNGKQAQRTAIAISSVSFIIWVNVMDGHFGFSNLISVGGFENLAVTLQSAKAFLATVALVIWTILVPVFYKGDAE